jgi:hypothetical protein
LLLGEINESFALPGFSMYLVFFFSPETIKTPSESVIALSLSSESEADTAEIVMFCCPLFVRIFTTLPDKLKAKEQFTKIKTVKTEIKFFFIIKI